MPQPLLESDDEKGLISRSRIFLLAPRFVERSPCFVFSVWEKRGTISPLEQNTGIRSLPRAGFS